MGIDIKKTFKKRGKGNNTGGFILKRVIDEKEAVKYGRMGVIRVWFGWTMEGFPLGIKKGGGKFWNPISEKNNNGFQEIL